MSGPDGHVPPATETIHLPRPSWAPAFLALGVMLTVVGFYLDFIGPNWIYSVAGGIIALAALRSAIVGARRDYFRLPRRQQLESAALPADSIRAPSSPR